MNLRRIVVGVFAAALLGSGSAASADEFIKPGDSVTLELPIENGDTGGAKATGVTLTPTFEDVSPAGLASYLSVDQPGSILGPFDIEVGANNLKTFKAKVVLAAGAPDGSFKVKMRLTEASTNRVLMPDPETLDTVVIFTSNPVPFSLDRLG